jgi:hypothetical protein
MTQIVVHAVQEFALDLSELHNDSTTVTVTGQYVMLMARRCAVAPLTALPAESTETAGRT